MEIQQKVLSFIRMRGPSLPVAVSKELNTNILMASAIMAEMVSRNELRLSSLKVGGSPLYYIKGQEFKLQNFAEKLNSKDRETYTLLKEKQVLRDVSLSPLERVSIRKLKDFAIPLKVKTGEDVEFFWRWFLLTNEHAETIIKQIIGYKEPKESPKAEIKPEPEKPKAEKPLPFVDKTVKDDFLGRVKKYFESKKIRIVEFIVVRKNAEIDFVIELPSAVGSLRYFCKAKSKQRSNDTDLAAALVKGQMKNLPALYLAGGELTKRAKEMLDKELKGVTVKMIEDGDQS
ncbi:MAG: hypothetical protein ABIG95_06355 [Candidatus Woesearchaeota archaeon]